MITHYLYKDVKLFYTVYINFTIIQIDSYGRDLCPFVCSARSLKGYKVELQGFFIFIPFNYTV